MKPKNNEELKKLIKDGVLNCEGEDLICNFNIDIDAGIVDCRNISAWHISAWNISAWNISARNISAWNILARNISALDISARNISARDISAWDISAEGDISAWDISAKYISYWAYCIAYGNIECISIKGRRSNSFHKALDGEVIIKE